MLYDSYTVTCKNGHNFDLSVSELEEVLKWGNCPKCSANIGSVDPPETQVVCAFCGWEETNDWESAVGYFFSGCPRCSREGEGECNSDSVHIAGSFYNKVDFFEYYKGKISGKEFVRLDRPDYREIVIHFCKRDELISILDTQKALAKPTGYYRLPAVCLSEVPLIYSSELRKRHGDYGLAFRKKEILEYGGQPAIYLTDNLI